MVRLCKEKEDWTKLGSTLVILNKRRAQSKIAITAIVHEAIGYLNSTPTREVKVELIKILMGICGGKIYVEGEDAKLHMMLAIIYEEDGDIQKACDVIQDVHVETYGALSKKEKAEYILQQIRLNLLRSDYLRALIQSRKMNRKVIEEPGFEAIKREFYRLIIIYYTHEKDCFQISQAYYKVRFVDR